MDNNSILLSKNLLVKALGKPSAQFTKDDIIHYITDNGIEMVNFMYAAEDGRLKTLNFVINSLDYLDTILSQGERVDGSSLFSSIEAGNSDLYVIPRYATAFVDPFAPLPTLTMLCSYLDKDGNPFANAPQHILHQACQAFTDTTGYRLEMMGELEYYVISDDDGTFAATDQRGYHESAPFAKSGDFRTRCMSLIASTGGMIKYGHSEVGNFTLDGKVYEQNEIEFLPVDPRQAADQLVIAKWVIRNLGHQLGYNVTFAPKITTGKAGSGLHIHMRIVDPATGRNMMLDSNRRLSDTARTAIAGIMDMARSITAFGNTNPTSYFRLVPHQEAPTSVCWGDRNRSVLVRVPLGWTTDIDMCAFVNPGSHGCDTSTGQKQTVELRSADASANVYLLMAALAVACRHGWEMNQPLAKAGETYVDVNIHQAQNKAKLDSLEHLPASCHESAQALQEQRDLYQADGVFPPSFIDSVIAKLRAYDDASTISAARTDLDLMRGLVEQYFHCG